MLYLKDFTWSTHARFERQERMTAILMTVGFGEICYTKKTVQNRLMHFTTSGCILISEENTIVTGYLSTHTQMLEFFNGEVPSEIRKIVKQSNKIYERYVARI